MMGCASFGTILFLAIAAAGASSPVNKKYVSCDEITAYCTSHGSSLQNVGAIDSHSHDIFRQGKAGPKGQKGDRGAPGPRTDFDSEGFARDILTKVKELFRNCGVFYRDSCFRLVGMDENKYSKQDLELKCKALGGKLANLYNDDHRLIVSRYVRGELGKYAQIALGMTYSPKDNTFYLTTGEEMKIQFNWHSSYPLKDQINQDMFFSVDPDPATKGRGAFNYKPHSEPYGLCEYEIDF